MTQLTVESTISFNPCDFKHKDLRWLLHSTSAINAVSFESEAGKVVIRKKGGRGVRGRATYMDWREEEERVRIDSRGCDRH